MERLRRLLTLQLAHAFLLTGDIARMDACLSWAIGDAAYATVSQDDGPGQVQVAAGAWNEQHCYPIATDFTLVPDRWWYMGDIPHGWAAAEFNLLLRDICFFEADEDGSPHIFIAAGVPRRNHNQRRSDDLRHSFRLQPPPR